MGGGIEDPSFCTTRTEKDAFTFTLVGVQRETKTYIISAVCGLRGLHEKGSDAVRRSFRRGGEVLQSPQCNRWIERSRNQISNRDHGLVGNCLQKGNALHF